MDKIGWFWAGVVRCSGLNGWRDVTTMGEGYGYVSFCWKNRNHAQTMVISDLDTYPRSPSFPHHPTVIQISYSLRSPCLMIKVKEKNIAC